MPTVTMEAERVENQVESRTFTATVVESGAAALRVRAGGRLLPARLAASCLLEPESADTVLAAGDPDGRIWVLAVLERAGTGPARLAVEGDLSVQVRRGGFSVAAADGIDLVSARQVKVIGSDLEVRAERGSLFVAEMSWLGRSLSAHLEKVKLLAGALDTVLERITQRVKRSFRVVEELDHLRSGQISWRAEKNLDLRGRNALVIARELVKLDGDQIHLG